MSPNSLSLASLSSPDTPPHHAIFNFPATSNFKYSCLNLNLAFPKLLYIGPRLSLGHLTLKSVSLSLSESEPRGAVILVLPNLACAFLGQKCFDCLHLSLQLHICLTRVFGPSDSLESDGSTRPEAVSPRTFRALWASVFRARYSINSPIVTVLFGWATAASNLTVPFDTFFQLNSLLSLLNPDMCCRSTPDSARNTLTVRPTSDSSVTLDNSSWSRWFSHSNCSRNRNFFGVWSDRTTVFSHVQPPPFWCRYPVWSTVRHPQQRRSPADWEHRSQHDRSHRTNSSSSEAPFRHYSSPSLLHPPLSLDSSGSLRTLTVQFKIISLVRLRYLNIAGLAYQSTACQKLKFAGYSGC